MARGIFGTSDSQSWLYRAGAAAALSVLVLFLIGIVGLLAEAISPSSVAPWFASVEHNWLVVLFEINAGLGGVHTGTLNVLDLLIMALLGGLFLAVALAFGPAHRLWSLIAAALPWLGIPILLITSTAGRSGALVGGLVLAAVMQRSDVFGKASAWVGLAASALLFFGGDIGTTIYGSSPLIAVLIGLGYVLWMGWFALVARRLFQLGRLDAAPRRLLA